MSSDDLKWLIGIAVAVTSIIVGTIIGAFRNLSGKIEKGDGDLRKAITDGDDKLHERINRVKDEYVRRVDLDDRLEHLQETQSEMRGDIKAIRDNLAGWPGGHRTGP